MTETNNKCKQ